MNAETFITQLGNWAKWAGKRTGLHPIVILAQWADETGWGTSEAWTVGHNPAGISPNGAIAHYADVEEGMNRYVETMKLPYYDHVRAAFNGGAHAQAIALGQSPWAAGQYGGHAHPGADLVSIMDRDLSDFDGGAGGSGPAPSPGSVTPAWSDEVAGHWQYNASLVAVVEAFRVIVGHEPASALEWHQVSTWAFEISDSKATIGGVVVEISQLAVARFKLRQA
jgi:hypothetical protein